MTPLQVLAKAGEIALRHGPDVVNAWKLIEQSLLGEHPELVTTPALPDLHEVDEARERARKRT